MNRAQTALLLAFVALNSSPVNSFMAVAPLKPRSRTRQQMEQGVGTLQRSSNRRSITIKNTKRRPTTSLISMEDDGESEWYVPPPPTPAKRNPAPRPPRGAVPDTRVIESNVELLEFLGQDDRLCLVKFHASWCKSCQKFGLHFDKLAAQKADWVDARTGELVKRNSVRIASVEWSKSEALCRSLGITKLPTVQFYAGSKKLTQVSVGAAHFAKVRDAVDQYTTFSKEDLDFAAKMEAGANLIQSTVLSSSPPPASSVAPAAPAAEAPVVEDPLAALKAQLATSAAVPAKKRASSGSAPRRRWWTERKREKETA